MLISHLTYGPNIISAPREQTGNDTHEIALHVTQENHSKRHLSSLDKKPNHVRLVCPKSLPSTYRYSKIANKSTHGIVYHVKLASPQPPDLAENPCDNLTCNIGKTNPTDTKSSLAKIS